MTIRSNEQKKTLNVVNITEEGRYGGPQARITKVARELRELGVETTVICPSIDSEKFVSELQGADVPFISIRMHRMTLQLKHLIGFILFFIPEVFALRKLLKDHAWDLIHCNGSWQIKGMIASMMAGVNVPVVYHLNDTNTRPVIKVVFSALSRKLVDAFMPACQRSREYYLDNPVLRGKKSHITPAPVDTMRFDPDVVCADERLAKMKGLKIITVCNINYGKGLEELIQLCGIMSAMDLPEPVSFCVVGPVHENHRAYQKKLVDMIAEKNLDNFHFMGPSHEVQTLLKGADVYVCISRFESSPMAVWEAMAMGLPVVSTDVGDVKQYLEQGKCGFCVPVGSVDAMAEELSILIKDEKLRADMGKKSRMFAVENLDLKICAKNHASFYRELVDERCNHTKESDHV